MLLATAFVDLQPMCVPSQMLVLHQDLVQLQLPELAALLFLVASFLVVFVEIALVSVPS